MAHHAHGEDGIGWIRGVIFQVAIEIIDLEKDRMAFSLERAKVMLFMRVVGMAEIVEHGDGLDDAGHGLLAKAIPLARYLNHCRWGPEMSGGRWGSRPDARSA
jgi:hypothetical protein